MRIIPLGIMYAHKQRHAEHHMVGKPVYMTRPYSVCELTS